MVLIRKRRQDNGPGLSVQRSARAFVTLDDLLKLRHRARGFSFLPRQPIHSLLTGQHASKMRGRGLNFEELRHYFEGDDTRTIDWLVTARLGTPHVRVYTEERDRPVLLVVDQRATMFFGSRRAMKSVAAAEAAALAAWRVTSLGDRIGAIVFGDREIVEIKPQGRDVGATRVLAEVARQNKCLDTAPQQAASPAQLNEALRRSARLATHDCLVCLITDASGADSETTRIITGIAAHNDVLAIFVADPLEEVLPDVGRTVFSFGERQIEVETSESRLRRRFAAEHIEWRARLAALSRDRAIPVLPISTDRDVADQLRELIGKRLGRAKQSQSGRP
jgi:uncharacterized protein (DUF58 family)